MVVKDKTMKDIRDQIQIAVQVALQEALQMPLHVKVHSSSMGHTELFPEGDLFNIRLQVEVHPKKEEPPVT